MTFLNDTGYSININQVCLSCQGSVRNHRSAQLSWAGVRLVKRILQVFLALIFTSNLSHVVTSTAKLRSFVSRIPNSYPPSAVKIYRNKKLPFSYHNAASSDIHNQCPLFLTMYPLEHNNVSSIHIMFYLFLFNVCDTPG